MNILIKILPVILISVVFYLLIYVLYPQYKITLELVKKLNELQNKEREINNLEKLINALSQNINIQQLIANREILNLWLPRQSNIEEIFIFLNSIFQTNNLVFKEIDINISEQSKQFNPNVLPIKVINFGLSVRLPPSELISFIEKIEKNTRLMRIKQADISPELANFEVETYYLSTE